MKEVVITVHNTQKGEDGEKENIEFMTDGVYEYADGEGRLTYFESEVTGLPGTRTRLFIRPDGITVSRDGSLTSRMDFKERERSAFVYSTPYGQATLGIRTNFINQKFDEHGGQAIIDYVLDYEHAPFSRNRFECSVRETRSGDNT